MTEEGEVVVRRGFEIHACQGATRQAPPEAPCGETAVLTNG